MTALEQTKKRLANLVGLRKRARMEVGTTPADVVHSENKWRLLRYRQPGNGPTYRRPILMVPSLINRYYVLDLAPGRSLVEYLVAQGHDVFMIDWGTPSKEDRFLTFDDVCEGYIGRAVRKAARLGGSGDVHLLGYCLGGTLAILYAAAHPEKVASLTTLAAPVAFSEAGMLAQWTRSRTFDLGALVSAFGNVPWPLLQASFHMLRPTLTLQKTVNVIDRAWDDEFLDGFVATEKWGNDNVSFPGACYQRYIEDLYREDRLIRGEMRLGGKPARLESITCPTLAVTFEHDTIVPVASAAPLIERVGAEDKERVHLRGGHVGAVVSRKAAERLWPQLSAWWAARQPGGETAHVRAV